MGRNLASIVLETHEIFAQYAESARQADTALPPIKQRLSETYPRASYTSTTSRVSSEEIVPPSIQAVRLIDRLLPCPGVLGIRQSVYIARPGDHAHNHEYYIAKAGDQDPFYLFKFYDDERRWTRRYDPYNTKLHQRYSILSAGGQDAGSGQLLSGSARNYFRAVPCGETQLDVDIREELIRPFAEDYWPFNKSGEPVIRAIITTDGKTTQPYDTLHFLKTIYAVGGIRCPKKMQAYMEKLEQQETLGAVRPASHTKALQLHRQP